MLNRRDFLFGLSALPLLIANPSYARKSDAISYLSARTNLDGQHFISGLNDNAQTKFNLALPSRGHAVALSPDVQQAVAIARRPGDYLMIFDTQTGKVLYQLESHAERHFYGHGVYSPDGRWFYTTENDFTSGQGMIGVRDTQNTYRQTHEFPSYGIGPHELALLSDGKTLVVANGGIQTHPDTGRAKLNLQTMQPSLTYIDRQTGQLVEQHSLAADLHQNSIRHLALASDDQVCCVMQYQGKLTDTPPLIGLHRRGENIQLLTAPSSIQRRMRNYCGGVAVDKSGSIFAVSAPRGGLICFWQAGDYLGHVDLPDGCGIAASERYGEFILSSGNGSVLRYHLADKTHTELLSKNRTSRWDNHLLGLKICNYSHFAIA